MAGRPTPRKKRLDRYAVQYMPEWERYPHLAKVFEHRPTKNVYWKDLRSLLAAARADAVQYIHDVRADELSKARELAQDDVVKGLSKRLVLAERILRRLADPKDFATQKMAQEARTYFAAFAGDAP